jgi:hypothetical protein
MKGSRTQILPSPTEHEQPPQTLPPASLPTEHRAPSLPPSPLSFGPAPYTHTHSLKAVGAQRRHPAPPHCQHVSLCSDFDSDSRRSLLHHRRSRRCSAPVCSLRFGEIQANLGGVDRRVPGQPQRRGPASRGGRRPVSRGRRRWGRGVDLGRRGGAAAWPPR